MSKPLLEKLIQEIAMFDMAAAFTLHCRKDKEDYRDNNKLTVAMVWRETPEGHKWWDAINDKLEARRNNYHPHRDLMIELANDKTIEIEYFRSDGSWRKCEGLPSFHHDDKYRKKPKVTKKIIMYRLYIDHENEMHFIHETDPLPEHFKKWLGDWQNVEIEVEENN